MSTFLLCENVRHDEHLSAFGTTDAYGRKAVAIFTSAARARRYIAGNDLRPSLVVNEVNASKLFSVLIDAWLDDAVYLVVNPAHCPALADVQPRTIGIGDKLAQCGAVLARDVLQDTSPLLKNVASQDDERNTHHGDSHGLLRADGCRTRT